MRSLFKEILTDLDEWQKLVLYGVAFLALLNIMILILSFYLK